MKKILIIGAAAAVGLVALGAPRFVTRRGLRPTLQPRLAEATAIWRPASETDYSYVRQGWYEVGSATFQYDTRGNCITELQTETYSQAKIESQYDANDQVTLRTTYEWADGDFQPVSRREYTYDPVLTTYYTSRMGYDYLDGEWIENYFCETNEITRNAQGSITDIVKALPLNGAMVPAYRTSWTYDPATGQASEFAYYANESEGEPIWEIYYGTSYKSLQWAETDGQMTESQISSYTASPNRLLSADVYYYDEIDGHILVEYTGDEGDYLLKNTYADPTVVGTTTQQQTTLLDSGNRQVLVTYREYFDAEGNPTTEPTFTQTERVEIDTYGHLILDELSESVGQTTETVAGYTYDYRYDAAGNPTEIIISGYDYDAGQYAPESRIVYGEYVDVTSTDSILTEQDGPVEYYNMQGIRISAPQQGLPYLERCGNRVVKRF